MSFNHPTLGRMRGKQSQDGKTIQYRGIKYASIPGRWQDCILSDTPLDPSGTDLDATKHGPSCPQDPKWFAFDLSLVRELDCTLEEKEQDEFECLNLVVTVPAGVKEGDDVPVFAW